MAKQPVNTDLLEEGASLWTTGNVGSAYDPFSMSGQYVADDGVLQLPVAAADGTPCVLIKVHAATMRRVVEFQASRQGIKPKLPRPVPDNTNEVRGAWSLVLGTPTLGSDGKTRTYSATGSCAFYMKSPSMYPLYTGQSPVFERTQTMVSGNQVDSYVAGDFVTTIQCGLETSDALQDEYGLYNYGSDLNYLPSYYSPS